MRDSHGGGGPVAPLHAAVLAEGDVEALVNKRLVGVVVVGQQRLPELALVREGSLENGKGRHDDARMAAARPLLWRTARLQSMLRGKQEEVARRRRPNADTVPDIRAISCEVIIFT